jgi:hypothetical protein
MIKSLSYNRSQTFVGIIHGSVNLDFYGIGENGS